VASSNGVLVLTVEARIDGAEALLAASIALVESDILILLINEIMNTTK
jgi:hypothetical protein